MLFVALPLLLLVFFSSSLIFVGVITVCLGAFLEFILPRTLCASWTWVTVSFPVLGKFSAVVSSNIFSSPFFPLLLGPLHLAT